MMRSYFKFPVTCIMVFALAAILSFNGCSSSTNLIGKVVLKGSTTMQPTIRKLAGEFMHAHSGTSIYTEEIGTELGIQSLLRGETDIALASRGLNPSEIRLLSERYGTLGVQFLIAKDAMSIYTHPTNPVQNLSRLQLQEIFSGKITNWKEVGGNDQSIQVYIRPPNSGTHGFFRERVLENGTFTGDAKIVPTNEAMAKSVSNDKGAIGFGGIGYTDGVKHPSVEGVVPAIDQVRKNRYPLTRYLYFITLSNPSGLTKQFIDWVLSQPAQRIIEQEGYISIWENTF